MSDVAVANDRPADTRARILSAALLVFAERGFEGATIKEITTIADANIAAVNYHFRSKDELVRQVLETFLRPINDARLAALDACERRSRGVVSLRKLSEALVWPMVQLSRDEKGGRALIRLLLQVRALPRKTTNAVVASQFDPVHERFVDALHRALPKLSREDVIWRYDFARGAIMQVLADLDPHLRRLAALERELAEVDDATIVEHLVSFIVGGFSAGRAFAKNPAPRRSGHEGDGQRRKSASPKGGLSRT
jgi:AcrR family transcriptional regulator